MNNEDSESLVPEDDIKSDFLASNILGKKAKFKKDKKLKSKSNFILDWSITILIALLISFLLQIFIVEKVMIKGSSMYPTFEDKEFVLLSKVNLLLKDLYYDDIVVFQATEDDKYIKRIIGLPGDTIEIKNDVLYRNGNAIDETYLNTNYKSHYLDNDINNNYFTKNYRLEDSNGNLLKIPDGFYFVLGDNRPFSEDSRKIGLVSKSSIDGVVYNFWSF